MTEDFQARAGHREVSAVDLFVPRMLGVGIITHETATTPAVLLLNTTGEFSDTGITADLSIALDAERAVGLIVQLQVLLLDASLDATKLIEMMKDARARLDAYRAGNPSLTFTCPRCGRVSYNPNDVEHDYCGACHDFTGDESGTP